MNYAFRYFKNSSQIKNVDEIIIDYNEDTKASALIDFIQKHEGQRIIADAGSVDLTDKQISIFKAATAAGDFAVRISIKDKEHIPALKKAGIKFFFKEYCSTWDILKSQLALGVSDVYIVSEMLFSLDKVKDICRDVKVRVFPNVAQSTAIPEYDTIDTFKCAWISPYDVPIYEKYIDVFEFFGPADKQDVLYKVYKSGKWIDDLNQLILGFKDEINANMLPPGFADRRVNCGKRCNYSTCTFCQRAKDVALAMHENGYSFQLEELYDKKIE